jgi:hypothetical protein
MKLTEKETRDFNTVKERRLVRREYAWYFLCHPDKLAKGVSFFTSVRFAEIAKCGACLSLYVKQG